MNECAHCKSTQLEKDVLVTAGGVETRNVKNATLGPLYSDGKGEVFGLAFNKEAVETMFAEICKKCGTVRLYIKNTDKNWCK